MPQTMEEIGKDQCGAGVASPPDAPSREEVQDQLRRLLESHFFSSSKRCPAMLSYVVANTLEGRAESLKERSLGVEVFHRRPDYDTNIDPIVRLAAGDIRKRLAQYYCEPEHEKELRITLPSGSYVPKFHLLQTNHVDESGMAPSKIFVQPAPIFQPRRLSRKWVCSGGLLLLLAAVSAIFALRFFMVRSAFDTFWFPIRDLHDPVLICVGQPDHALGEAAYKESLDMSKLAVHVLKLDQVTTADAMAASRLSGVLGKLGVTYSLQGSDSATFSDMRNGPALLVSGADNQWTMRAIRNLRFHFDYEQVGNFVRIWVSDQKNPAMRNWAVDFNSPYTSLSQDYALVGRFTDPTTGQMDVLAAGISSNGTLSASECLSNTECLHAIFTQDPSRGRRKNIEAVIGTQVIGGRSGPPVVLAVYSW